MYDDDSSVSESTTGEFEEAEVSTAAMVAAQPLSFASTIMLVAELGFPPIGR
jgi:hypothetical protein